MLRRHPYTDTRKEKKKKKWRRQKKKEVLKKVFRSRYRLSSMQHAYTVSMICKTGKRICASFFFSLVSPSRFVPKSHGTSPLRRQNPDSTCNTLIATTSGLRPADAATPLDEFCLSERDAVLSTNLSASPFRNGPISAAADVKLR